MNIFTGPKVQKPVTLLPEARDMLSHEVTATGDATRRQFVVTFDYPDCTRSFDGRTWSVKSKE